VTDLAEPALFDDRPVRPKSSPTGPDRAFRGLATGAAMASLVIVVATLVFLVRGSRQALHSSGIVDFFTKSYWRPTLGKFGAFGLMEGTMIIALLAVAVAAPLGIGMALFINEYAPGRLRTVTTSVIDLLAALPSILFGLWGLFAFKDKLVPIAKWIGDHLSVFPFFRIPPSGAILAGSSFVAGMVLSIMILPIITSVSRDVMAQAPREQCEGALALGGTRWGMIRSVILPFGRNGIVGAVLLGLGRALGETIAVALVIVLVFQTNTNLLTQGASAIAPTIALRFGEASPVERSGLVAIGLALFIVTLVVNLAARAIVSRTEKVR